jgi:hypothetical protein
MLDLGMRVGSILGCMHWSLVEFATPVIATSDHPVDVWPMDATVRAPAGSSNEGALNAFEVRVPLTPTSVLLMTWLDENDATNPRLRGATGQAENVNTFTVANADRQWFHLPETNPPVGSGPLEPLSPELISGYNVRTARGSERRTTVSNWLESTSGQMLSVRDKLIIT